MIVYKTTNLINGKIYIGQDSKNNPKYLGSGRPYFIRALKKYGKENFKKEILVTCNNKEELNEREIYWIKTLNTTNHDIGYNIALGGGGILGAVAWNKGKHHSEETKQKMSKTRQEKHFRHSEETKRKISEANKGRIRSEETKQKMSEAQKGRHSKPTYDKRVVVGN